MLPRFNPDAIKQSVKDATRHGLARFGEDVRRHRPVDWFAAAVATGAARGYRLGQTKSLSAWGMPGDDDITIAAKQSVSKVRDAAQLTAATLVEWTHAPTSNDRDAAGAAAVVENRMALHLAMHGLQWALDLRHRTHAGSADSQAPDLAILALARELSKLDEHLHRQLIPLSSATRTETLVAMRSLMRPRDFLPWWLDGTLETVAVAQTVGGEKRSQLNAILERDPADPEFVRTLVPALDGPRATIGHPTDRIDVNGSRRDVYAWKLPDADGVGPSRVELVAPSPGGRGRVLELRVQEPSGAAASRRPPGHGVDAPMATRPDHGFLAGRVMLINGIPFIWFRSGGRATARASMGASPVLPTSGQIQLVDCSTNAVLEPVSPR